MTDNGRPKGKQEEQLRHEWVMAFIIKRARQKGNGMIARHHPSFYSLPSTPFSRPSISLYLLWPDRCLPLSPLPPSNTPPLPLTSPPETYFSPQKGPCRSLCAGHWTDEAAEERMHRLCECCIWNAKCNRAWGWGSGLCSGGGDHEHTVMCCSQPYTRPSCSLRVEPVGIQFIIHQICFVAASEKKRHKWSFRHSWCSINLTSTLWSSTLNSWMWDGNEPLCPTLLPWRVPRCCTPPLPAPSLPFCRLPSRLTGSDILRSASLSIFLLARNPERLICPCVLTLFHHVSNPFPTCSS